MKRRLRQLGFACALAAISALPNACVTKKAAKTPVKAVKAATGLILPFQPESQAEGEKPIPKP